MADASLMQAAAVGLPSLTSYASDWLVILDDGGVTGAALTVAGGLCTHQSAESHGQRISCVYSRTSTQENTKAIMLTGSLDKVQCRSRVHAMRAWLITESNIWCLVNACCRADKEQPGHLAQVIQRGPTVSQ